MAPDEVTLNSIDKKLAVLCEQTKNISSTVNKIEKSNEARDKKINDMDKSITAFEGCIKDNKDEIDLLRGKSWGMELLNAFLAIVAAFVGIFISPKN